MLFATLIAGALQGGLAYLALSRRAQMRKATVSVDTSDRSVVFRHFQFISTFLPEKPREEVRIRFEEVIAAYPVVRGVEVRTTKGKVQVPDEMDRFPVLASALGEIASSNAANQAEHQKAVAAEPKVRTAWYGWLILAAGVGIVFFLVWKLM